jgi:hypothetical protein
MTTTDIDHLEGLELRRRVLTLLGWGYEDGGWTCRRDGVWVESWQLNVESSPDALLEHAVPFIEERGWSWEVSAFVSEDGFGWERIARVMADGSATGPFVWATGPRTTHLATLLCRALLKAVEAQG